MSIHAMIHHPLIYAAIALDGLDHAQVEKRLEAGESFGYGGSPREGAIMSTSISAHTDTIRVRYVTQGGRVVRAIKRHAVGVSVEMDNPPPDTLVNAMAGLPLSEVAALPGGEGLTIRSAQVNGAELRLEVE